MGSVTMGSRSKTRTCRDGWKALWGALHTWASAPPALSCVFLAAKPSPHHALNSQGAARARAGVCITGCHHGVVGTAWVKAPAGCHAVGAGRCCPRRGPKAVSGVRGSTAARAVAVTLQYRLAMLKISVVDC